MLAKVKRMDTVVTNENCTQEEIKLTFYKESLVFPSPLKRVSDYIYKTIILHVVLHGCETWSLYTKRGAQTKDA
jgi:hypothetical protein